MTEKTEKINSPGWFKRGYRVYLTLIFSSLVLTSSYFGFIFLKSFLKPPAQREQVEKIYNVEVFDARVSNLQEIISAYGTARSDREVVISAQVSGEIVEIHPQLKIGQKVKAAEVGLGGKGQSIRSPGELLARIDPETYQRRVTQAEKLLAEDEAELTRMDQEEKNNQLVLNKMKADFEVYTREFNHILALRKKGVNAESDVTRARLQLQQYETSLIKSENEQKLFPVRRLQTVRRKETHQIDLQLATLDLERTEARPPFNGTLSEVHVEQGQYVRVGDPLATLTDIKRVEIPIPVSLDDYAKIEAFISQGKFPRALLAENETVTANWEGQVVRVSPVADEESRTVNIFVVVDNTKQKTPLLPGTFVHARIDGPVLDNVIAVPRDAITNGRLFVAKEGLVEERTITIKRTLQSLALIDTGITSEEEVILTNLDIIHNGAKVQVQLHRTLDDELQRQRIQTARPALAGGGASSKKTNKIN